MLLECAAEEQECHDENGDPENADRDAKGAAEAEAHRATLRVPSGPSSPCRQAPAERRAFEAAAEP
jgi:hypothetical protein